MPYVTLVRRMFSLLLMYLKQNKKQKTKKGTQSIVLFSLCKQYNIFIYIK